MNHHNFDKHRESNKMRKQKPLGFILTIGIVTLLLFACGYQAQQTSIRISPTNTVVNLLPTERRWQSSPVVMQMSHLSEGMMVGFGPWGDTADLVIYRDGLVLKKEYKVSGNEYSEILWEGRLTEAELCSLLIRVEEDGFFDFASSEYEPPRVFHVGATEIEIQAWKQQAIRAYALGFAIQEDYDAGIPEGLIRTYQWMDEFIPANAKPYTPERIHVRIESQEWLEQSAVPLWNLENVSLTELLIQYGTFTLNGEVSALFELEGEAIEPLWSLLREDREQNFREGNRVYNVGVRPVLPYEEFPLSPSSGRDGLMFMQTPTEEMDCTTTDRVTIPNFPDTSTVTSIITHTITPTPTRVPNPMEVVFEFGSRNAPGQFDMPDSVAVSPTNEIVVGDGGNYRLQWFTPEGELLRITPLEVDEVKIWPGDMHFSADGTLFVLDNFYKRIYHVTPNGQVTVVREAWTGIPRGNTPYPFPDHLIRTKDGTMYVTNQIDEKSEGIIVLRPDGSEEIWKELGGIPLSAPNVVHNISGIGIDDAGNFYVALRAQNLVLKVAPDGIVTQIKINEPMSLTVMPDGSFYVSVWSTVLYLDQDGKHVYQWQPLHSDNSIFDQVVGGLQADVYIVNGQNPGKDGVIEHYRSDGEFLNAFGDTLLRNGQFSSHIAFSASTRGDIWVLERNEQSNELSGSGAIVLQHIDSAGNFLHNIESEWFSCTQYFLAAHSNQTLFVANPCNGTITQYAENGEVLGAWGALGTGSEEFNVIRSLALDPEEQTLYVVDEGNQSISRWSLTGDLLGRWQSNVVSIKSPIGVAVDTQGVLYVLDKATNDVVVIQDDTVVRQWTVPADIETVNTIAYDVKTDRIYVGGANSYMFVYDTNGTYIGQTYIVGSRGVQLDSGVPGQLYASTGYTSIYVYEPK
jgi:sugar lactone lactonase YvrE